ncbi:MAG TPA: hypothetical protein VE957_21050 [Terriglobales bacterium]|nr:hypothetical protein [Terriglobales bacterium]
MAVLIVGIALLASPRGMLAQRGGGGGRGMPTGGGAGGAGRPGGVDEKDDLKDFHRAMAVRATAQQSTAFATVVQDAQAASDQLRTFRDLLQKVPASSPLSDRTTALDQAIEKVRTGSKNFLASFSSAQKSGLKDITKKLAKADSDLVKQIKTLDQIVQTPKPDNEQIANSAANLDKALAGFQSEQLALGREMSILLPADSQDLTFNLPKVTNSINVGGQTISIPASGGVSRTSAENALNLFSLKLVADLSDLQQNITGILRSQLTRSPRCGERIEIQQATLIPLVPASLVVVHLHFERWVCPPGQESPMEVADGEGTIEVKLTPSLEQKTGLGLVSEIGRVDAEGFLRDMLRSGDLGATLRDQIAASLLSAMQRGTDTKITLPPAAQESATIQKAQFQDAGAGQLCLVLDGQLQFSDEQTKQFATQLKQRLSAQGTSPP